MKYPPMSRETRPALAASMSVPHRRFLEPFRVKRVWRAEVVSPGTLFVLVWWGCFLGVAPGPNIPLRVLPNRSLWLLSDCVCCRDAMNSATGGKVPLPLGCGAMLKPFISRRSFWRFFFPPAPVKTFFARYFTIVEAFYRTHDMFTLRGPHADSLIAGLHRRDGARTTERKMTENFCKLCDT